MTSNTHPTEKELAILQLLWKYGPSTVRFVHDKMQEESEVGYTTTLKLMQIMADKGLLSRDKSTKNHIYHPMVQKDVTQQLLTQKFIQQVFQGSSTQLVMRVLGQSKASQAELDEVKAYLESLENKKDDE